MKPDSEAADLKLSSLVCLFHYRLASSEQWLQTVSLNFQKPNVLRSPVKSGALRLHTVGAMYFSTSTE